MYELPGPGDVARLGRLVACAEQNEHHLALLREIDPIAGPGVHPQLMNPTADSGGIAQVTEPNRLQARQDSRLGLSVFQLRQPAGKNLGLADLDHAANVSVRIRPVKALRPDLSGITLPFTGGELSAPHRLLALNAARSNG